jgi:hypothetical protein
MRRLTFPAAGKKTPSKLPQMTAALDLGITNVHEPLSHGMFFLELVQLNARQNLHLANSCPTLP